MQVVIVSPHVFMLVIGTIQGLMRDAKMREQAHAIQGGGWRAAAGCEAAERAGRQSCAIISKCTSKDIGQIEISMRGIDRHAERIAQVDLGDAPEALPKN